MKAPKHWPFRLGTFLLLLSLVGCGSRNLGEIEKLLAAGQYVKAQGMAQLEATAHPKDARAHFLYARTCLCVGEEDLAKNSIDRALPLDPKLQSEVGPAYLEAAKALYADANTRNRRILVIRGYLDAAQKFGYPASPETDRWISTARKTLVTPQERTDRVLENVRQKAIEIAGTENGNAAMNDPAVVAQLVRRASVLSMALIRSVSIAIQAFALDESNSLYPDASDPSRLFSSVLTRYYPGRSVPVDGWDTPLKIETSRDRKHYRIVSAAGDREFEELPPLPDSGVGDAYYKSLKVTAFSDLDEPWRDLIYVDGKFVQYPEGLLLPFEIDPPR